MTVTNLCYRRREPILHRRPQSRFGEPGALRWSPDCGRDHAQIDRETPDRFAGAGPEYRRRLSFAGCTAPKLGDVELIGRMQAIPPSAARLHFLMQQIDLTWRIIRSFYN